MVGFSYARAKLILGVTSFILRVAVLVPFCGRYKTEGLEGLLAGAGVISGIGRLEGLLASAGVVSGIGRLDGLLADASGRIYF